ncbi:MAG: MBL fold metallo-hydrolase [Candidatus Paceibacterota bacterium]
MIVTYYGASCFKVQAGETVLAFNPPSKESDFKSPRFAADAVFISNENKDNNGRDNLAGKEEGKGPIVIDGSGEYEIKGVYIKGIKSSGLPAQGGNTIYRMKFEDIILCHLGNFAEKKLAPEIKEAVGSVDILFAPAGSGEIANQLEPKIAIPMDYKNNSEIKKFADEFGNGASKPVDKLTIKKKDLIDDEIKVVVLEPMI